MKLLELCTSRDLGGLELYCFHAAAALSETDEVIGCVHPRGRLTAYFRKAELPHVSLHWRFSPLPLLAARRLARIIDRRAIDVVHVHHGKDLALAVLAKRMARRSPLLVYTRQMQITRPKRDRYHEFLYRHVDRILTITQSLAESVRARLNPWHADKVRALYLGVKAPSSPLDEAERSAIRAQWGVPADAFVFGLFGRKEEGKGQHLLIEALARFEPERRPYAVLVGHAMNEPYVQRLLTEIATAGLGARVILRDFIEQPQRWMQACDGVVLTTYEETFGLVLAEAMRCGIPVIGSDRGGVPEIIDHDRTGLLFRSQDASDLHRQLKRLCDDPALRQRLAVAGKDKADRVFDEQVHFAALRREFAAISRAENVPR